MFVFFFNDTATTEIYTLSLHDALPISGGVTATPTWASRAVVPRRGGTPAGSSWPPARSTGRASGTCSSATTRSEEHTSELQSRQYLVCRLLLEKKNHYNHPLTSTSTTL